MHIIIRKLYVRALMFDAIIANFSSFGDVPRVFRQCLDVLEARRSVSRKPRGLREHREQIAC